MNKKFILISLIFFNIFSAEQTQKVPNDLFALDLRTLEKECKKIDLFVQPRSLYDEYFPGIKSDQVLFFKGGIDSKIPHGYVHVAVACSFINYDRRYVIDFKPNRNKIYIFNKTQDPLRLIGYIERDLTESDLSELKNNKDVYSFEFVK